MERAVVSLTGSHEPPVAVVGVFDACERAAVALDGLAVEAVPKELTPAVAVARWESEDCRSPHRHRDLARSGGVSPRHGSIRAGRAPSAESVEVLEVEEAAGRAGRAAAVAVAVAGDPSVVVPLAFADLSFTRGSLLRSEHRSCWMAMVRPGSRTDPRHCRPSLLVRLPDRTRERQMTSARASVPAAAQAPRNRRESLERGSITR